MRFPPAHAAPRDTAPPPKRRIPKPLRTALSVAVAGVIGLVPAVMVPSPAQAAPSDFLTIADAGNWEGNAVTFTATYTGTSAAGFRFTTVNTASAATPDDYVAIPTSTYGVSPAMRAPADVDTTNTSTTITSPTAQFTNADVGSTITGAGIPALATIASVTSATTATLSAAATATATITATITATGTYIEFSASSVAAPSTATVVVAAGANAVVDTADETFTLRATPVNPATGPTKSATGTIWDAATYPGFTFVAAATVSESQATVAITANLNAVMAHAVTIPVATSATARGDGADATTLAPVPDYTPLTADTSSIVIAAGQLSGSVNVSILDDGVYEPKTQYFRVSAGTPVGATGTASVDVGIVDNDTAPTVSIGNATDFVEANGNMTFPVTLSTLSEDPVTVSFVTADGVDTSTTRGATDGDDYTGVVPTTVTIPAYNRTKHQAVGILTDLVVEGSETINATISSPDGATLGTPVTATGTITDDDLGPVVTWQQPTTLLNGTTFVLGDDTLEYVEGDTTERATYINLTIPASASHQVPLQLDYSFVDVTATNGVDYRGTSGSLTVPVGKTTATPLQIPITIIGDKLYDPDETFKLVLASANGTIPAITTRTYTIIDTTDAQPTWTTGNVSVVEGNSGTTLARVPVKLSGATNVAVTFSAVFSLDADSSADEAGVSAGTTVGENDYNKPSPQTVTVPIGSTTAYFDIPVNGDVIHEHNESFTVTFSPPGGGIVDSTPSTDRLTTAQVTITNDDAAPTVTFNQLASTEGSTIKVSGTTAGLSQYPYTLTYTVAPIGTNPATAATDYEVTPNPLLTSTVARGSQGTLYMGGSTTASTIAEVYLSPDDIDEATETFGVTATETTAVSAGIATTTGTYRISDDPADVPPTASISDETIKETDGSVDVTVSLAFTGDTKSSTQDFSLTYYTVDGSAVEPEDYTETRGELTIPAGTLTKKINIPIKQDTRAEPAQNFFVKIGTPGPTGATLGKYSGEVMIGASTGTTDPTDPTDPTTDAPTLKSLASFRLGAGKASLSGKAGAGATVELWGRNADSDEGDYAKITQTTASSSGAFAFQPAMTTHGMYFMAKANSLSSAAVKVSIREDPDIAATSTGRRTVKLTVTGDPKIRGLEARVFRVNAGGRLTLVGSGRLTATGTFTKTLTGLASGRSYTYKAYVVGIGSRGILTGYSSYTRTVRVR
jgi:hypothetical protein